VGSQRLTASAMARPVFKVNILVCLFEIFNMAMTQTSLPVSKEN
jgi:hypothetical protein